MNKKLLEVNNLSKTYYGGYVGFSEATFSIDNGIFCIIGEKDSGKTSLLKTIAGLESASGGSILYKGTDINSIPIRDRNIGMTFGEKSMPRGKTVRQVIEEPLRLRKKARYAELARASAERWRVDNLYHVKIKELSAVQKKLVELARLFAVERDLYLIDNPLEELNYADRKSVFSELKSVLGEVKGGIIYATDSLAEATAINAYSYAIACYNRLTDIGSLREIYAKPQSVASARIVSDGRINAVECVIEGEKLIIGGYGFVKPPLICDVFARALAVWYIEDTEICLDGIRGAVKEVCDCPRGYRLTVSADGSNVTIETESEYKVGDEVRFTVKNIKLYDAVSEQNILDYRKEI